MTTQEYENMRRSRRKRAKDASGAVAVMGAIAAAIFAVILHLRAYPGMPGDQRVITGLLLSLPYLAGAALLAGLLYVLYNKAAEQAMEDDIENYQKRLEADKERKTEAALGNWTKYRDSELVQRAGKEIARYYNFAIREENHRSDRKEIKCALYLSMGTNCIEYYDPSKKLLVPHDMSLSSRDLAFEEEIKDRFYKSVYQRISYTGEGWNFESITDPGKLLAVTKAISMVVCGHIEGSIAEAGTFFPNDRNGRVEVGRFDEDPKNVSVTITYTAENKRYVPPKKI